MSPTRRSSISSTSQGSRARGELGQTIGADLMSSILPEGFKDPIQTGAGSCFRVLQGLMGMQLPQGSVQGGDGASLGGGGGGGGLLSGLTGLIPQPFGPVQSGSPGNVPGEFMPLMPSPADAGVSPFQVTRPTGLAGPGNQVINAPININNPVGQDHLTNMMATAQQAQVPPRTARRQATTVRHSLGWEMTNNQDRPPNRHSRLPSPHGVNADFALTQEDELTLT